MQTSAPNKEKEYRILDAAVDLFIHYGFDKTTVSDIARNAGISKGAIYLHFESKDTLFEGLILRELQRYAEKWLQLIEEDPIGGTIAGMYKNSLYAMNASALMTAIYKQDGRILGSYLKKPGNFFEKYRADKTESDRYVFVKMMQDAGAMRVDLDAKVIAHVMDIVAYGLVSVNEIKPREDIPAIEDVIEGIAEMMDTALSPPGGADPEIGKSILRNIADAARQHVLKNEDQE